MALLHLLTTSQIMATKTRLGCEKDANRPQLAGVTRETKRIQGQEDGHFMNWKLWKLPDPSLKNFHKQLQAPGAFCNALAILRAFRLECSPLSSARLP